MTPNERMARADRAKGAMDEFVGPAFDHIENEWMEKLISTAGSSDPRVPEIVARVSAGIAAIRKVRAEIMAVVADGAMAESELRKDARVSQMSDYHRSVIGA